jgi:hypothetical protein
MIRLVRIALFVAVVFTALNFISEQSFYSLAWFLLSVAGFLGAF